MAVHPSNEATEPGMSWTEKMTEPSVAVRMSRMSSPFFWLTVQRSKKEASTLARY